MSEEYREDLDQYADQYLKPSPARSVDRQIVIWLAERVIPRLQGPRILEMGFGDGVWTDGVIARFGESHLVDGSGELVKKAREHYGERLTAHESFFEEFQPPQPYDSIICSYVLEHVVDPVKVLSCCRAWLKPGGLLFAAVPAAGSLHRRLGVAMGMMNDPGELGEADRNIGHRRVYDEQTFEDDLAKAGFRIETNASTMCKPLPNGILTQLSDKQLKGLFELGDSLPLNLRAILAVFCRAA